MSDNIAKYVIIALGGMFTAAVFSWFMGGRLERQEEEYKKHPLMFSYFSSGAGIHGTMLSSDKQCIPKLNQYYNEILAGKEVYVPSCFDLFISPTDEVYVLENDKDGITAKVCVFYTKYGRSRKEYIVGYVVKWTLNDTPFEE